MSASARPPHQESLELVRCDFDGKDLWRFSRSRHRDALDRRVQRSTGGKSRDQCRASTWQMLPSLESNSHNDQRVEVHVEVQRTTKALNHHDRSAPSVGHAGPSRPGAQEAEHGSHVHAGHRAAQGVVPREHAP
jgi:hypothetical protein